VTVLTLEQSLTALFVLLRALLSLACNSPQPRRALRPAQALTRGYKALPNTSASLDTLLAVSHRRLAQMCRTERSGLAAVHATRARAAKRKFRSLEAASDVGQLRTATLPGLRAWRPGSALDLPHNRSEKLGWNTRSSYK